MASTFQPGVRRGRALAESPETLDPVALFRQQIERLDAMGAVNPAATVAAAARRDRLEAQLANAQRQADRRADAARIAPMNRAVYPANGPTFSELFDEERALSLALEERLTDLLEKSERLFREQLAIANARIAELEDAAPTLQAGPSVEQIRMRRRDLQVLKQAREAANWNRWQTTAPSKTWGPSRRRRIDRLIDRVLLRGGRLGRAAILLRSGLWAKHVDTQVNHPASAAETDILAYASRLGANELQPAAFFHQDYYISQHPSVGQSQWSPLVHYLLAGEVEGRSPHPLFDTAYYRDQNGAAMAATGLGALQHFFRYGALAGANPHPLFETVFYVARCPEISETGENPLLHYLRKGWREGLSPHPVFDNDWYLSRNPDVAAAGVPPLLHFLTNGADEGRDPHPLFRTRWYRTQYPEPATAQTNPLADFLLKGGPLKRMPSPEFDTEGYLRDNPDVEVAGINPLVHYLTTGAWEERQPLGGFDAFGFFTLHPQALLDPDDALTQSIKLGLPVKVQEGVGRDVLAVLVNQAEDKNGEHQVFARVRASLTDVRRERAQKFVPTAPSLVNLAANNVEQALQKIRLNTSTTPEVSIIIPVYNQVRYTVECIAALTAAESDISYEVIVVDDGSQDDTARLFEGRPDLRYIRNTENLGFVKTCNRGAAEAKGQTLVFLNNDVQVAKGWLEPLLEAFRDNNVGIAAPKLMFPDGRLQEAGARIDPHGSSEMIGLFEDPDQLRYNYTRAVDYASGAVLAVRRDLFQRVGGFDIVYAPSYCEDVDLCFQIAALGYQILYVPASKAYHHLSITADAMGANYKLQQVRRNQQTFIERWGKRLDQLNKVRVIALYLPQYHPIAENDEWWGAGFTEWTNVRRAQPNYAGHHQPREPADLGYYDLNDAEVMDRQADLAKLYGVDGFCYYYYWFSGRRVLEMPLDRLLKTGKPDIPFCICWANENWTRTWDGQERDVLLAQKHDSADAEALIADLAPYLRMDNYIRIDGKPLLVIYRPTQLPDIAASVRTWRDWCRKAGIGEIYLAYVENFEIVGTAHNPRDIGFDASIEFPPAGMAEPIAPPGALTNPQYKGVVSDYSKVVRRYAEQPVPPYTRFRGVAPGWDNTARRQDNAYIFHGASPGAFQAWLQYILDDVRRQNVGDERIVFVNAWNEWAEGTVLEPDKRFGHGWLEAVRNAKDAQYLLSEPSLW